MLRHSLRKQRAGGFTLIELAVVMVIVAILATMLLPMYSHYLRRADEMKCMANLRGLYVAASGYLQANGSWPQIPSALRLSEPKVHARNWVETLKPFGAPHNVWICPSAQREMGLTSEQYDSDQHYRIDFLPMAFNDQPSTPRRWPRFPWFVEKGNFHGRGNLIIFADGSTAAFKDVVADLPGNQ